MLSGEQAFQISSIDDALPTRIGYALSATFLHDGSGLVTGGHQDSTVRVHRLSSTSSSTQAEQYLDEHRSQVISVALSRNGQKLLTGDTQGLILLWDLGSATVVRMFSTPPPEATLSLSFSADADLVAACGSTEGSVYIWKTSSRTTTPIILRNGSFRHLSAVFANGGATVSTHPDTPVLLATVCSDGIARVYSVRWGTSTHATYTIGGEHIGSIKTLCWFPGDRGMLLVASKDMIQIATVNSGPSTSRRQTSNRQLSTKVICEGHTKPINAVCVSPCARYIASTARDGPSGHATVRVWNAVTGEQLLRPLLVRGGVRQLEFSPQGNRLLTIDVNGAVNVCDFGVLEVPAEVQGAIAQFGDLARAEEEMTEALQLLVKDECARFTQMTLNDCKLVEDILRTRRGAETIEESLDEFQSSSEALFEEFRQNMMASKGSAAAGVEKLDKTLSKITPPCIKVEKSIQGLKNEQAETKKHLEAIKKTLEKTITGLQKLPDTIAKNLKTNHVATSTPGAGGGASGQQKSDKTAQKSDPPKNTCNNPSNGLENEKPSVVDLSTPDFSLDSSNWLTPTVSKKNKRKEARNTRFSPASTFPGLPQAGGYNRFDYTAEDLSEDVHDSETEGS